MTLPIDDPRQPLFTVGQVAEMLDVQQAFLRRLETRDLVTPGRSEGNQRRYSRADIEQIRHICGLVDEGLTLAGVQRVVALQAEVEQLRAQLRAARRR